ncbi:hypothetical protein CGRA01v4_12067 [Colletotrichum graminicola]|nr:hypothetical protein CGRA01v4_12067 [Colletotrichum graminicola]
MAWLRQSNVRPHPPQLRPTHHNITQFRSPVTTATPLRQRHADNSNNSSFFFCASRHNSFAKVSTIFPFERVFYSTTTSTAPKLFFFFIRYSNLSPPPQAPSSIPRIFSRPLRSVGIHPGPA